MSDGSERAKSTDAWVRWGWVWNLMAYAFLAVAGLVVLTGEERAGQETTLLWLLAFGAWYSAVIWLPHSVWTDHPLLTLIYYAAGLALWVVLIQAAPFHNILAAVLYPMVFMYLPLPWAIAAACALVAAQTGTLLYTSHLNPWLAMLIGVFSLAGALAIGVFIHSIIVQSHERQRLIEELNLARDELAQAERQAGMLAERQRLAGEIHDSLAQGFTSIVMHLEAAEGALARDPGLARRSIDQARQAARDGLAEARRMVWALRPDLQERPPVQDALRDLAARQGKTNGLDVELCVEGSPHPLPPEIEATLLKAAREALANIHKHSGVQQAVLTLTYMEDLVVLDVRDEGRGFSTGQPDGSEPGDAGGGFGLKAMRAEVERLGGQMAIESAPGEGTSLAISLPVRETSEVRQTHAQED